MTNKKISQLPSGSSIVSGNLFAAVQTGTTYQVSASQILDYVTGSTFNNLSVENISISSLTASAAFINNGLTINGDLAVNGGDITSAAATLKINEGKTVSGTIAQFTSITGSVFGTASYANNANLLDGFDSSTFSRLDSANIYTNINTFSGSYITASAGITGSDAKFSTITGSFSGNGGNITGITSSNINNFTTDVRNQFSAGTGIAINVGQISASNIPNSSLQYNNLTIGTTTIALGETKTILQGLEGLTSSYVIVNDLIVNGTASIAHLNTLSQSSLYVGDKYITILSGATDHVSLDGSGFLWGSGSSGSTVNEFGANAHVRYRNTPDKLEIFPGLLVSGSTTLTDTISGTVAEFTAITASVITASYISASQFIGPGIGGVGDVTASGSNTFTGINTFSSSYITASVGITGSDAKFTTITGSFFGNGSNITGITSSNINNFTADVRSQFSPGANVSIINGVISSTGGGFSNSNTTVTSDVTLDNSYYTVLVDASASNITITLPSASIYPTSQFNIKRIDTSIVNLVTVSASSGETIDGFTHILLDYRYEGISVLSNGTSSWFISSDVSSEVTLVAQGYINPVGSNNLYVLTGTAPGGDDQTVQFNDSGILTGSINLKYNKFNSTLSGTTATFEYITASIVSASQFIGPGIGGGVGDVTSTGSNTFTGVNTFSSSYITASAGITGSDAKFATITGTLDGTASYAISAGNANTVTNGVYLTSSNTFTGINTFSSSYITASAGITGSDAKFATITGSFSGSGAGLTSIPNYALQNSTISINSQSIPLGSNINILAGAGLTGSIVGGSIIVNVGQGTGILIGTDDISVDTGSIVTITGSQTISGIKTFNNNTIFNNITVNGTASIAQLNTISQSSLIIGDKYITILSGGVDHATLDRSGILWGSGSTGPTVNEFGANAHLRFDGNRDVLEIFPGLYVSGTISLTGNLSGGIAEFTVVSASIISASQLVGIEFNSGDVTSTGSNTFTGINTFSSSYITASVGITGSDAKFTSITGTILQARLKNLETSVAIVSADTTLTDSQHVILASASVSNIIVTLPLANNSSYRQYIIKKIDNTINKIIISGSSGQTIDGNMGRQINTQYETVTLISDGNSQWFIL